MDKNSVIGFVLIAAIFLGFTVFENKRAAKYAEVKAQQDSIALAQMPFDSSSVVSLGEYSDEASVADNVTIFGQGQGLLQLRQYGIVSFPSRAVRVLAACLCRRIYQDKQLQFYGSKCI